MGKKIKLREAQRRAEEHAIAARLRVHSGAKSRPGFIETFSEFSADYRARIERYRRFALRAPEDWRCRLRVRSPEQRFLELVRFTFAAYPAPQHLENAWLAEANVQGVRGDEDEADYRRWYITVAQGGSLYRTATLHYMTRLETHYFTSAPASLTETQRAFWYAFARAQNNDVAVAMRVARTKLANFSATEAFWQDVARFFARNPTGVLEMNDLIDFIEAARQADETFSLRGRTLAALRERMEEWHRAQRDFASGLRWRGVELPDAAYETASECGITTWRFHQIKLDHELSREGERMGHCVATYCSQCLMGEISIWSLTCETPGGTIDPCLTIELRNDGTIGQCRGRFNRAPTAEEAAIVRRWADEFGLAVDAYELQAA